MSSREEGHACTPGPRAQRALASISRHPASTVPELVAEAIDAPCPGVPPPLWETEIDNPTAGASATQ